MRRVAYKFDSLREGSRNAGLLATPAAKEIWSCLWQKDIKIEFLCNPQVSAAGLAELRLARFPVTIIPLLRRGLFDCWP